MKRILSLTLITLAACANPYSQFYKGWPDARLTPQYEHVKGDLQIYSSDNFDRDARRLITKGYTAIGVSSFSAGMNSVSESQLREHASRIGAHAVLVSSRYSHTLSGVLPLTIPTSSTSYSTGSATAYGAGGSVTAYGSGTTTTYGSQTMMVPYSVDRGDFAALFFAKTKSRLGIRPRAIDDDTRMRLQTNAGIAVDVVTEDTPAYAADVVPGDVVLSIGGDRIESVEHFYALLDKYESQRPVFKIDRNGTVFEKEIMIRSKQELDVK